MRNGVGPGIEPGASDVTGSFFFTTLIQSDHVVTGYLYLQILQEMFIFNKGLKEAIDEGRIHSQWIPKSSFLSSELTQHKVNPHSPGHSMLATFTCDASNIHV
jgi:hypothetical protein